MDTERDALQVYHTIKNLPETTRRIDPREAAEELRRTINTHIQDEKLRQAYNEVVNHYLQTHHLLRGKRGLEYLQALLEEERRLGRKLMEKGLTKTQIARLRNMYRVLNLLTARETLRGLKEFHREIAEKAKEMSGGLLPIHGPIIANMADDFSLYRRAPEGERWDIARFIAATYEPLLMAGPYVEKKVAKMLNENRDELISLEEHREFIRTLERMQMRRPEVKLKKELG